MNESKNIQNLVSQRKEFEERIFEFGQGRGELWALNGAHYQDLVTLDKVYNSESDMIDVLLAEFESEGLILDKVLGHIDQSTDSLFISSEYKDNIDYTIGFLEGLLNIKHQIDYYNEALVKKAVELTMQKCKARIIEAREGECSIQVGPDEIIAECHDSAIDMAVNHQLEWLKKQPEFEELSFIENQMILDQLSNSLETDWSYI